MRRPPFLLLALVVVAVVTAALSLPAVALEVPYLSGRVVDEAGLVPPDAEQRIAEKLAAYEAETGTQVAVLTIPALQGESLEDYSLRVAETWQLGREGVDDGVLLLVARDDRQMRLEVGYGLEPRLTDLASRRILDEVVRPRFRNGDFGGGIEAGTDAVVAVLRDGEDALPQPPADTGLTLALPVVARLGALLLFLAFMSTFAVGALASDGCAGWFLGLFLVPFFLAFPSAILHPMAGPVSAVLWVLLFVILRLVYRGRRKPGWMRSTGRSGGGGFFGGGFSGGGSSGGGFSGGGGSFGGGGASSSW